MHADKNNSFLLSLSEKVFRGAPLNLFPQARGHMITFTRVKGLSHKNVAEKGHGFPARMDRPSNSRAPDLFCVQVSPTLRGERVARNAKAFSADQKALNLFQDS